MLSFETCTGLATKFETRAGQSYRKLGAVIDALHLKAFPDTPIRKVSHPLLSVIRLILLDAVLPSPLGHQNPKP